MNLKKLSIQDMCFIAIFTTLIAICAQISIPLPGGIPFTLQTLSIQLAGIILGAKKGALSAIVYVFLGAIGIPVFARFGTGLGIIIGPTGGFILSFPIMAFIAGLGANGKSTLRLACGLIICTVVNFLCGMFFFTLVMSSNLQTAFTATTLPFIPSAIIKIVLLTIVGERMKTTLEKSGLLA